MASTIDVLPVTIIVPTSNRAQLLREAIASLLQQSRPAAQILVIDDGSTDETADVATAFGKRLTYVKLEANQGKAAALNRGLTLADMPASGFSTTMTSPTLQPSSGSTKLSSPAQIVGSLTAYAIVSQGVGRRRPRPRIARIRRPGALLSIFACWRNISSGKGPCWSVAIAIPTSDRSIRPFYVRRTMKWCFGWLAVSRAFMFHISYSPTPTPGRSRTFPHELDAEGSFRHLERLRSNRPPRDPRKSRTDGISQRVPARSGRTARTDTALIQRSSIMARVGVWDLATADLAAAAQQAKPAAAVLNSQELNALRRVFERWARSTFDNIEQGQAFFAAVGEFESRALRNSIKAALIWPYVYQ